MTSAPPSLFAAAEYISKVCCVFRICITAVLEVWLWHKLPLCLLVTCHSGIFQPASRDWKTDFLFDFIIYYSFTIPVYSHPCLHHWNGWPSDSYLPGVWPFCMIALQPTCAVGTSMSVLYKGKLGLSDINDISTSVSVCHHQDKYIRKVSWVCFPCMTSALQSLCGAARAITLARWAGCAVSVWHLSALWQSLFTFTGGSTSVSWASCAVPVWHQHFSLCVPPPERVNL